MACWFSNVTFECTISQNRWCNGNRAASFPTVWLLVWVSLWGWLFFHFISLWGPQHPLPPLVQRLTPDSQETSSTLASTCGCGLTLFLGISSQLRHAMQFPKDQCERCTQSAPTYGTPPTKKWAPVSCTQIAPTFLKTTLEPSFGTGRVKNHLSASREIGGHMLTLFL